MKFESILRILGYDIDRANKFLQNAFISNVSSYQEKAKWEIVDFHIENNEYYKCFIGNKRINKWTDLPILTKQDYQSDDIEKLLSKGFSKKNTYISSTSGSSGHPFYFAKDKFCHALAWWVYRDRYSKYGITLNSLQARFYGIPLEKKAYLKEKVKDKIMNRVRFPIFDLSEKTLEVYLKRFRKKKFDYLYGYSSSILLFARFLLEKEIVLLRICPTLKLVITTSEVCLKQDKELMEKAFGVKVVDEYGSSELGIMAFTEPNGRMRCTDELIFFENHIKDDGTNVLLCTSLFNKAFPIIRYEIGDSVSLSEGVNGYHYIDKIEGRVNDLVVLPSGKISPGLTFYYISRSILESSGVLQEFVVRQIKEETFVFEIVSKRKLSMKEEDEIRKKVELYIESGLKVEFKYVSTIKRTKSGKLKHFFSEL
jgi:phenylacetate-CoA ligase